MALPDRMMFIEMNGAGAPEIMRLASGPLPTPKPDELLIRVQAAGVNRPDIAQRQGSYPPPAGASPVLGLEVAGEVASVGATARGWRIGDKVCALANGGGYAEYCTAPAAQCLPWPKGYDAVRAAAIQLARAFDATVYATAGSDDKCAACVRLGCEAAINYRTEDFAARIKDLTGGRGVDVILDMVGGPYATRNIRSLGMDGRLVLIAFLGGSKVENFDLVQVMVRRLTITGSTMRPRTTAQKGAIALELRERVWPVLDAGRCAPVIHATYPLDEVAKAHKLMESSEHIGKIMLEVG